MNIAIHEQHIRILTLSLRDRFDVFTAPALRAQIDNLLEDGLTHLIVDMTETTFLDSAAIAVLVGTLKRLRQMGGELVLVWPKAEEARRIFQLTKFHLVFTMTDTALEAESALGANR